MMYEYQATLVKVVDGDTVDVDIDLGFRVTIRQRCRLAGVNTPELHGSDSAKAKEAKAYTEQWFAMKAGPVRIQSSKPYADDKYGRFLVTVLPGSRATNTLNEELVARGLAVPFMVNG